MALQLHGDGHLVALGRAGLGEGNGAVRVLAHFRLDGMCGRFRAAAAAAATAAGGGTAAGATTGTTAGAAAGIAATGDLKLHKSGRALHGGARLVLADSGGTFTHFYIIAAGGEFIIGDGDVLQKRRLPISRSHNRCMLFLAVIGQVGGRLDGHAAAVHIKCAVGVYTAAIFAAFVCDRSRRSRRLTVGQGKRCIFVLGPTNDRGICIGLCLFQFDAVAVQAEGQILLDLQHILRVDVCAQVIVAALRDRGLQVGQAPYRVESDQRLLRVVADVLVCLAAEAVLVFRGGRLDGCACSEMRCIFNRHSM